MSEINEGFFEVEKYSDGYLFTITTKDECNNADIYNFVVENIYCQYAEKLPDSEPDYMDDNTIELKTDDEKFTIEVTNYKVDYTKITPPKEMGDHWLLEEFITHTPKLFKKYGIEYLKLESYQYPGEDYTHMIEIIPTDKINTRIYDTYIKNWISQGIELRPKHRGHRSIVLM